MTTDERLAALEARYTNLETSTVALTEVVELIAQLHPEILDDMIRIMNQPVHSEAPENSK